MSCALNAGYRAPAFPYIQKVGTGGSRRTAGRTFHMTLTRKGFLAGEAGVVGDRPGLGHEAVDDVAVR